MQRIDVTDIDLNLLGVLSALLETGSVTAAAGRLGLGQPATSHALARLRALFDDALLVRSGRRMVATPRAEALREPLARVLTDAVRLVQQAPAFDPASTERTFTIASPDLLATALPSVMARLRERAPRARLEIVDRTTEAALEQGRVDLTVGPAPTEGPGLRVRRVGAVSFCVVARRGHPALAQDGRLRRRAWSRSPHVVVRSGSPSRSVVGEALAAAGLAREIGLVVPSFLAALVTVATTDLFFAAPRQLVRSLLPGLGLVAAAPPIDIPALGIAAVWHERFDADPASRFLRGLVVEALGELLAERPTRGRRRDPSDRPRAPGSAGTRGDG